MSTPPKPETTETHAAMLHRQDMNFSLARTCEIAAKKCFKELGLYAGSAAIPPVGNTGKWTIRMEVENSQGAHVSITFSGYAETATSESTEGR
jgi:hypothetical protein